MVSSALAEMQRIIEERYPTDAWNIYAAQASDGDNYPSDSETCTRILRDELLPLCQYFAYIEVVDEREAGMFRSEGNASLLWRDYKTVADVTLELRHEAGVLQVGHLPRLPPTVRQEPEGCVMSLTAPPSRARARARRLLFETGEWNFDTLKRTFDAIEEIAIDELGLDPYPVQVEMISSEQMLDAYSSIGMPVFYHHWSFGKRFTRDETHVSQGLFRASPTRSSSTPTPASATSWKRTP